MFMCIVVLEEYIVSNLIRQFQIKELFYGFSYLDFAESQTNFYLQNHLLPVLSSCNVRLYICLSK